MTDFKQYLLDEFVEDYQEGLLSRRDALKLIAGVTGSLALATSLLAACAPPDQATPATAATTAPSATSAPNTAAAPTTVPTTTPQATATIAATSTAAANTPASTTASGDIEASNIEFDGSDGAKLLAHLARPAGGAPAP